jgi:hypothetical protein
MENGLEKVVSCGLEMSILKFENQNLRAGLDSNRIGLVVESNAD